MMGADPLPPIGLTPPRPHGPGTTRDRPGRSGTTGAPDLGKWDRTGRCGTVRDDWRRSHNPSVADSSPARPTDLPSGTDGHRVHIGSLRSEGRTDDRARARPSGGPPAGDHPPRPGGDRQRLLDLPLLRDHAPGLLHLAPSLRRARSRGAPGPFAKAARESERHEGGGDRQDRLPAPELPLRTAQDRDVSQALPRHPDLTLGDLADPAGAWT